MKHRRRRHGRDAKEQKQHLLSRGTTVPLSPTENTLPQWLWDKQFRHQGAPGSTNRHTYSAFIPPPPPPPPPGIHCPSRTDLNQQAGPTIDYKTCCSCSPLGTAVHRSLARSHGLRFFYGWHCCNTCCIGFLPLRKTREEMLWDLLKMLQRAAVEAEPEFGFVAQQAHLPWCSVFCFRNSVCIEVELGLAKRIKMHCLTVSGLHLSVSPCFAQSRPRGKDRPLPQKSTAPKAPRQNFPPVTMHFLVERSGLGPRA